MQWGRQIRTTPSLYGWFKEEDREKSKLGRYPK
jgi:hypothetical protein